MMDHIEMQKMFFHPVCNKLEIERIFDVSNAQDYLLRLRAETIVDHIRLFRVYRNKALIDEKDWSLEKSFDSSHFDSFLSYLPKEAKEQCAAITFGNMFSNDPNGSIFKTKYGPIITISDSLKFFLKFSHLALLQLESEVPLHIRMNALRIAIRVMLKTEALDFFMDPRGIIPQDIDKEICAPIQRQLEFIAGHEFAHYVLGHLSDSRVVNKPIYFAISSDDEDYKPSKVFNQSQAEELEADVQAVLLPQYNPNQKKEVLYSALLWFSCLDLYEAVADAISPRIPWIPQSHPTPRERFDNLLTKVSTPAGFDISYWKELASNADKFKDLLLEDVSLNIEGYETYGSAYLDKPNTAWRGRKLRDRVDYY